MFKYLRYSQKISIEYLLSLVKFFIFKERQQSINKKRKIKINLH